MPISTSLRAPRGATGECFDSPVCGGGGSNIERDGSHSNHWHPKATARWHPAGSLRFEDFASRRHGVGGSIVRETRVVFRSAKDRPFAERKATIRQLFLERSLASVGRESPVPERRASTEQWSATVHVHPARWTDVQRSLSRCETRRAPLRRLPVAAKRGGGE